MIPFAKESLSDFSMEVCKVSWRPIGCWELGESFRGKQEVPLLTEPHPNANIQVEPKKQEVKPREKEDVTRE